MNEEVLQEHDKNIEKPPIRYDFIANKKYHKQ